MAAPEEKKVKKESPGRVEKPKPSVKASTRELKLIGGVDISFSKHDETVACTALVILSYPDLEVVYEDYQVVTLDAPYMAGFLAFREVKHEVKLIEKLRNTHPEYLPQVIFVDGNGVWHQRGFGIASHLGVLVDIPTIGISKNVLVTDGVTQAFVQHYTNTQLRYAGDHYVIKGIKRGLVLGAIYKHVDHQIQPIMISIGHRISLDSAITLTKLCSLHKIPEAIRQADLRSRRFISKSDL